MSYLYVLNYLTASQAQIFLLTIIQYSTYFGRELIESQEKCICNEADGNRILSDNFPTPYARSLCGLTNALLTAGPLLPCNHLSIPNQRKRHNLYITCATLQHRIYPYIDNLCHKSHASLWPTGNKAGKSSLPDQQLCHSNLQQTEQWVQKRENSVKPAHSKDKAALSGLEEGQYDQQSEEFLQLVDTESKARSSIPSITLL